MSAEGMPWRQRWMQARKMPERGPIPMRPSTWDIGAVSGVLADRVDHAWRGCGEDRRAQAGVRIRISAAEFCGDTDFFRELAEELASFLVEGAFNVLNF